MNNIIELNALELSMIDGGTTPYEDGKSVGQAVGQWVNSTITSIASAFQNSQMMANQASADYYAKTGNFV